MDPKPQHQDCRSVYQRRIRGGKVIQTVTPADLETAEELRGDGRNNQPLGRRADLAGGPENGELHTATQGNSGNCQ